MAHRSDIRPLTLILALSPEDGGEGTRNHDAHSFPLRLSMASRRVGCAHHNRLWNSGHSPPCIICTTQTFDGEDVVWPAVVRRVSIKRAAEIGRQRLSVRVHVLGLLRRDWSEVVVLWSVTLGVVAEVPTRLAVLSLAVFFVAMWIRRGDDSVLQNRAGRIRGSTARCQ